MNLAERSASDVLCLCEQGKIQQAIKISERLIEDNPSDNDLHAELAGYFFNEREYDQAIAIFLSYKKNNGRELRADFSLNEVKKRKNHDRSFLENTNNRTEITFRRMSLFKRGHFSNRFSLFPVLAIKISDSKICFYRIYGEYCYDLSNITSVEVVLNSSSKRYGAYSSIKFTRRTLIIKCEKRVYKVDISKQYPDLENSMILEELLREKFDVQEIDLRK